MTDIHAQTKATILREISAVTNRFDAGQHGTRFEDLGVDSFDLVTIRCTLEQKLGRAIPDHAWLGFRDVDDIVRFYVADSPSSNEPAADRQADTTRRFKLNMPQMAIGGLSESWMFRELGDVHWQGICHGLRTESHSIADDAGNRLYATFVRFRWEGSDHLKSFQENEPVRIENRLARYGKGMFFSDATIEGREKSIRASLMSAFTSRQGDNKSLLKGEPVVPEDCPIAVLESLPPFSEEYRQMRKRLLQGVELGGEQLLYSSGVLDEVEYALNPYQDFNGVNLLYFAAYPAISDICERQFAHRDSERIGLKSDWACQTSTVARDIFYFGNCEISETLVFRVHSFRAHPGGNACIAGSLSRKSDGQLLCNIFTVKKWHG